MVKVAVLIANDFEDSELAVPLAALRKAGHRPELIGIEAGATLHGKKRQETVRTDAAVTDRRAEDYDALLIPGGTSPAHLRRDPRMVEFVRGVVAAGKPVAAICHGPQLLITAGVVAGRRLTGAPDVQDELREAGAEAVDREVATDGAIVTSRTPDDLPAFVAAMLAQLAAAVAPTEAETRPSVGQPAKTRQLHPS